MKSDTYYITTPIYFSSGKYHIGHAYTTVAADAIARLKRLRGFDVLFMTGTDEHGQKIEQSACAAGVPVTEYVDKIAKDAKELWSLMNISWDKFIRTTDDAHGKVVQDIFGKLYEQGDIYKSRYEGLYCAECEAYWTKTQAEDGLCPDCKRPVQSRSEESYFFRLSAYSGRLMKFYEENPKYIRPESRMNEMINNFIKPGLEDLCVTRTSFKWGIPAPFDPGHVIYVWLDALTSYISALGYGGDDAEFKKYWPAQMHLMGKEIVRFHAIIWPCLLMALGLDTPEKMFGHGWLLFDGDKMSKSKGNVVDPVVLCQRYGVDAVRYFLMRDISFGQDGNFSNEAMIGRINSDLANDLGNLLSRTVAMAEKYFGGKPPRTSAERKSAAPDPELAAEAQEAVRQYDGHMEALRFSQALAAVWKFIGRANKYIDETEPWILAKSEDRRPRLAAVIYNLCESLRITAGLIMPIMPSTSEEILRQLGVDGIKSWDEAVTWNEAGAFAVRRGENMFPRLELEAEMNALGAILEDAAGKPEKAEKQPEPPKAGAETGVTNLATIEDFAKIEFKAAKVLTCKPVEKSDKLLVLALDVGESEPRQVVSGIAPWYKPEELVGRGVVLVSNLKPAKLRGVMSQGMILAADNAVDDVRVIFADGLSPGVKIR